MFKIILSLVIGEDGTPECHVGDKEDDMGTVGFYPTEEFIEAVRGVLLIEAAKEPLIEKHTAIAKLALKRLENAIDFVI